MNSDLFYFSGFFVSENNTSPIKIEGVFDILNKESISNAFTDLHLTSIIFKNHSLFNCKVSSKEEIFKQVKFLEFVYDEENDCYISKVFAEKIFERKLGIENHIEKNLNARDEIGIITIQIIKKSFSEYDFVNHRMAFIKNTRKREMLV